MTYALDSNTVSYFLRGEGNVDRYFQQEIIQAGNSYAIPFIVVYEVNRWLLDKPTRALRIFAQQFNSLFASVRTKAEMPADVWNKATEIYIALKQKGQLIGDTDILIAAYCLANNYTLVTSNTKDLKGLNLIQKVRFIQSGGQSTINIGITLKPNIKVSDVVERVQKNIKESVQNMTGKVITKVNVTVF